jgi:hypothetical protein
VVSVHRRVLLLLQRRSRTASTMLRDGCSHRTSPDSRLLCCRGRHTAHRGGVCETAASVREDANRTYHWTPNRKDAGTLRWQMPIYSKSVCADEQSGSTSDSYCYPRPGVSALTRVNARVEPH